MSAFRDIDNTIRKWQMEGSSWSVRAFNRLNIKGDMHSSLSIIFHRFQIKVNTLRKTL